jgi:hypothetical protein
MLSQESVRELRTSWLPNLTESALDRLIELLEKDSPLLVHGCFTRVVPMGCLATHAAWHHPETAHLNADAGITWLHAIAGLNPATSYVIRDWDANGPNNREVRQEMLEVLLEERRQRQSGEMPRNRLSELVSS